MFLHSFGLFVFTCFYCISTQQPQQLTLQILSTAKVHEIGIALTGCLTPLVCSKVWMYQQLWKIDSQLPEWLWNWLCHELGQPGHNFFQFVEAARSSKHVQRVACLACLVQHRFLLAIDNFLSHSARYANYCNQADFPQHITQIPSLTGICTTVHSENLRVSASKRLSQHVKLRNGQAVGRFVIKSTAVASTDLSSNRSCPQDLGKFGVTSAWRES